MKNNLSLIIISIILLLPQITRADGQPGLDNEPDHSQTSFRFRTGMNMSPAYLTENTADNKLGIGMVSITPWISLSFPSNIRVFVRGKDTISWILQQNPEDDTVDKRENKYDLDQAFIEFRPLNIPFDVSFGRKIYSLGSGVLLGGRGDGGEFKFYSRFVQLKILGMYSGLLRKDFNPYGMSGPDYTDGAKRAFGGAILELHFMNQALYGLGLYQKDFAGQKNDEKISYDSWYGGGGLKGFVGSADYFLEGYYQGGNGYTTSGEHSSIKAYGAVFSSNYYVPIITSPSLSLQYGFASGDKDRVSTSTATGNTIDNNNALSVFGYFPSGIALRPDFSNIHIARGGIGFNPFGWTKGHFRKLTLSCKYSRYYKHRSEGVIGNGEAYLNNHYIGQAIDGSLQWAPFIDVTFHVLYGVFFPGSAYKPDEPVRHFAIIGASVSI